MFVEISRVLTHPRCVNCHPADETPRQGDKLAFHDPPVVRGANDLGVPALPCTSCHQGRNAGEVSQFDSSMGLNRRSSR
jgi:hypothetical protein